MSADYGQKEPPTPMYSCTYLTYPSKARVGLFPLVTVIGSAILVFYLAFQAYFMDLKFTMTPDLYLEPGILDTLVLLTLPCSLLYVFVIFQVRVRLGKSGANWMSILHFIFCAASIIVSILYIISRPREAFSFMMSLMPDQTRSFDALISAVEKLRSDTSLLYLMFNDKAHPSYKPAMWVASYAYICQLMIAILMTTYASAQFGQNETFVALLSSKMGKDGFLAKALPVSKAQHWAVIKAAKAGAGGKK